MITCSTLKDSKQSPFDTYLPFALTQNNKCIVFLILVVDLSL